MLRKIVSVLGTALFSTAACAASADALTEAIPSKYAAQWLAPVAPLRIHGDTYYVGFGGLSIALIRTDMGLILIDGALPQSVAALEANIKQLGFSIKDVKYILSTEAHFDHAGGIAALARDSGASVVASPAGAQALRVGHVLADDPQAGEIESFPAVVDVREISDGDTLRLGGTSITAHATPGHTPGSTSYSWPSCENGTCINIVFGASLSAVSAGTYHFSDPKRPGVEAGFRAAIHRFAALPCDILISAHPDHSGMDKKLAAFYAAPASQPFIDAKACRSYAARYARNLDLRLAREAAPPSP